MTSLSCFVCGMFLCWREKLRGWCRAELLARLVGSGLHRLFLCDTYDGALQQLTCELVRGLDLCVFLGTFRCCSLGHSECHGCDREKLRTPILGVFAQYVRKVMAADQGVLHMLPLAQMEQQQELMFPRFIEVPTVRADMTDSPQVRELFGPLPEMVQQRVRESAASQSGQSTRPAFGTAGEESISEAQGAVIQSPGQELTAQEQREQCEQCVAQWTDTDLDPPARNQSSKHALPPSSKSDDEGRMREMELAHRVRGTSSDGIEKTNNVFCRVHTTFDEGEVTDLDLPRQREIAAGVHSEESPQLLPIDCTTTESLRHESGQASSIIIADRSSTHELQMEESEDWVVTDLDALIKDVENERETTRVPSRNEGAPNALKESTGSSISTEPEIESELL